MSSLQIPRTATVSSGETTPAYTPSTQLSPDATVVDLNAALAQKIQDKEVSPAPSAAPSEHQPSTDGDNAGCEIKISQRKKWSLLAIFSLAMFVDSEYKQACLS
jgi:hypothetical protein